MTVAEYEAVLFDNDGVLVELTDRARLREAVRAAFEAFDVVPDDEVVDRFVREDPVPVEHVEREYGIDGAAFWERREREAVRVQRADVEAGRKGLYEDVTALRDLDHRLGVVSNNQHDTVAFVLEHHELREHFECHYGRDPTVDGVRRKKPDPHYLERALDDLGTRDALYVGDSEKDVVAADRAGIDSAFLRRDHRADLSLSVEPTYEFADLHALAETVGGVAAD